jgi:hypothetical protein
LANANGTGNLTWSVQDNGGTANGGVDTLNQTLAVTVNSVNDVPVRETGSPAAINVAEDSANTNSVALGLSNLFYNPGGGTDEATQTLAYKITSIPSFVTLFKGNGTTQVMLNDTLTLGELQTLRYKTVEDANGTGNLNWTVQDSGGTANGGVDTLTETLAITVTAVNDEPELTSSAPAAITVDEDSNNDTAVTLGLTGVTYGVGGGSDENSQTLVAIKLTDIPDFIQVFQENGTTAVAENETLTLTQFQGLTFKTVADANGSGSLNWSVQDSGGTDGGGVDTVTGSLSITVNPVDGESASSAAMDLALLMFLSGEEQPEWMPDDVWQSAVDQAMSELG